MSMRSQPHQLNWNGHDLDSLNLIIDSINDMLGELYQQVSTLASTPASTGSSSLPDPVTVAHGGTGAITAAAARAALGLAIGTNVEAQSSELDAVAALAATGLISRTAAATYAARTLAAGAGIASITNAGGVAGNPTIIGITKLATSVTGAQNDYTPGVLGHTIEYWSGASDAAFTGLVGGVAGQLYTLKNTGTKTATFANQSGSSSAGNKFTNLISTEVTPVGPRGFITYQYDGTNWQLVGHKQGTPLAWTPVIGGTTSTTGQTYTGQDGFYELNGNVVFVQCRVTLSAKGTITGSVQIQGLPFTVANVTGSVGQAGAPVSFFANLATSWSSVAGLCVNNTKAASLFGVAGTGGTGCTALAATDIGNTTDLLVSLSYMVQ